MKPLRLAVVGAGVMGRLHARAISRRAERVGDCLLSWVVDRHAGRSQAVAEEYGGRAGESLEVLRGQVDAAVVAVPTHSHDEVTRALLEWGIDVLVEKPMSATSSEARSTLALARARDRVLAVGHVEWYNPALREAIRRAGSPRSIEVERLNPRSDRGLDIDVVSDFMLHDLDWVARVVRDELVGIEASGRAVGGDGLDEARAELVFASGCRARLRASRVHPERIRRARIEGTDATVDVDLLSASPVEACLRTNGAAVSVEPLDAEWADFIDACVRRREPDNGASVGIAAIEMVERVRRAIDSLEGSAARDHDPALGG